jgi:hypothetical protein
MAEDWRLRADVEHESGARELTLRLEARDLEHDLRRTFHDRVIVSRDGAVVFCYADSREQIEAAAQAIAQLANRHGWRLGVELERWHPLAERWESPDLELPHTDSERLTEHAELIESERKESRQQGFPMFEVRVDCHSRADAETLARKLRGQGIPTVQRSQFLIAGADDEDAANALAEQIRAEAPAGATVATEASVQEIAQEAPYATPFSPFAVFGGLGG